MTDLDEGARSLDAGLRAPPTEDSRFVIRCFGDESQQPVRFYLYKDVVEELVFASEYEGGAICASILLGGFGIEAGAGFVEVSGFTGASWVDDPSDLYGAIRPIADSWLRGEGDEPMVGVFIGRAGGGAHVDAEMARIHYSLFNIPFQPLIVYDPESRQLSVNARAPGTALFNAAFRAVGIRGGRASLNGSESASKRDFVDRDSEE